MGRCECIKLNDEQCTREGSNKKGDNSIYCWQHQNCKNQKSKVERPTQPKPEIVQLRSAVIKPKQEVKKINLYLAQTVEMIGGDVDELIEKVSNDFNRYLKSEDNSYIFEFDDVLNKKELGPSTYLGKGGVTAVFAMKRIKSFDESIPKEGLILRLVENEPDNDLTEYLEKWKEDMKILPNNIPEIYLYGRLYKDKLLVGLYSLVKKYEDADTITQLNMPNRRQLLLKLLETLAFLESKGYTYRDLKLPNIGYEKDDEGNVSQFIVLDHDVRTILSLSDPFFNRFKKAGCKWMCAGTYPPYYVIEDYLNKNPNWRDRLDKLSVIGLVTIIVKLFYGGEGYSKFIAKNFYPLYTEPDGSPYSGLKGLYNEPSKLKKLIQDLNSLAPLEGHPNDANDWFIKRKLLIPLLKRNYEDIPNFSELLKLYKSHKWGFSQKI